MSPGTHAPAAPRAASAARLVDRTILLHGVCIFAEQPDIEAPDARIIWHAALDPTALSAAAVATDRGDPDGVDPALLAPWLTIVADASGEHVVLSDGWHRIRLDIDGARLSAGRPVVLHYRLQGLTSAAPRLLPLRRLLDLYRRRRFTGALYPPDRRVERWVVALRVHDAVAAGASQRDIAERLFGQADGDAARARAADSLRSRVRRLIAESRRLAAGGYRNLLKR